MRFKNLFVFVPLALIAVSCGGDDGGSGATEAPVASEAPVATSFDSPLKIAYLWEIAGEGDYGTDDAQTGAELAVEEINAAGGVGGLPIETVRVAAPFDNQLAIAAVLEALDANPSAMIGLQGSDQVIAIQKVLDTGGVPLLTQNGAGEAQRVGNVGISPFTWSMWGFGPSFATENVNFTVDELGASKIGIMGTNESYGTSNLDAVKAALTAKGLTPFAERTYAPGTADLTEQVLAMKGADALIHYGFPNEHGVQLNQFLENGIKIPTIGGGSLPITVNFQIAKQEAVGNVYAVVDCSVDADNATERQVAFAQKYLDKYGVSPSTVAAKTYDSVYVIAAAAELAGSADASAVQEALGSVEVTEDVVCSDEYRSDGSHMLTHSGSIIKWSVTAGVTSNHVQSVFTTDDQPEVG